MAGTIVPLVDAERVSMHEFLPAEAVLRQALDRAPANARIKRLIIVLGEASSHHPDEISVHFSNVARGTIAEGAELQFLHERLAARCDSCGAEYNTEEIVLTCANCGGTRLVITAGNKVYLAGVEFQSCAVPYRVA